MGELRAAADIRFLALSYGLDRGKLQPLAKQQDWVGVGRKQLGEAKRNLMVLRGNQVYLATARIQVEAGGNNSHFELRRFPRSLSTIGAQRRNALGRAGHRLASNFTRVAGDAMYRFRIP